MKQNHEMDLFHYLDELEPLGLDVHIVLIILPFGMLYALIIVALLLQRTRELSGGNGRSSAQTPWSCFKGLESSKVGRFESY